MDTEMGAGGAVLVDPDSRVRARHIGSKFHNQRRCLGRWTAHTRACLKILDTDVVATDPKLVAVELLESRPKC